MRNKIVRGAIRYQQCKVLKYLINLRKLEKIIGDVKLPFPNTYNSDFK